MTKNILLEGLLLFSLLTFYSCGWTSTLTISSSLPAEIQQEIKTTNIDKVDYSFIPNENANNITVDALAGVSPYYEEMDINSALKPMMDELIQTKFTLISNNPDNKIIVSIKEINYTPGEHPNLSMTVNALVNYLGQENQNNITYSVELPTHLRKEDMIHNWLVKFVIGMDRLLNSIYDVQ